MTEPTSYLTCKCTHSLFGSNIQYVQTSKICTPCAMYTTPIKVRSSPAQPSPVQSSSIPSCSIPFHPIISSIRKVSFISPPIPIPIPIPKGGCLLARNKVVAASTSVGDEHIQVALGVKDDTISAGRAAGVGLAGRQDRELVPGLGGGEAEALVVVVLVGVGACWLGGLGVSILALEG